MVKLACAANIPFEDDASAILQHVLVRNSIAGFYRRVFSSTLNRNAPEYSLYFEFLDEALK